MGKTITSILTIGAAIAVNVIPGIGQAISAGIVGLGGGSFAAFGVAQAVVGTLTLGITVAGVQSALGIIAGSPNLPKPDTTATAIKTPRPPRVSAYGRSRLYGAYVLYETDGLGQAIDVYAVHDGVMDGQELAYLNDDLVTIVGSSTGGVVQEGSDGRYGEDHVSLYWTPGVSPGTAFPVVVSLLPTIWTTDHRGDGVVMMALICGPMKSADFLDVYPNGVPTPSLVCRWQPCPDPYAPDPTDPAGWTWTENPIRHLMHYKLVREGVDFATKIAPTIAYWRAASDVCDEGVPLKAGGTEARWRSCLSHKHVDKHGDVTGALLATCDGWIAPRADGALVVYAGKYYEPTVAIEPEHIVAYEWSGVGVDDDTAVNEYICSYISADHDFNAVECDAWRDEDDISSRGQILSDNLEPQVPSWGQVRRLAKRRMARTNALYRGTVTTNIAGRFVRGQRYIMLLLQEAGTTFYNGPAEITAVTRNISTGGVTFSWVAASASIDAWNAATEEGNPAAKGDRIAPEPLPPPTINSATADFSDIGENGGIGGGTVTGVRIIIDAEGPDRTDLTWYARWRVGAGAWTETVSADSDPSAGVLLVTSYVPYGTDVDVEVAYGVGDGRISDWSTPETVDTSP